MSKKSIFVDSINLKFNEQHGVIDIDSHVCFDCNEIGENYGILSKQISQESRDLQLSQLIQQAFRRLQSEFEDHQLELIFPWD